MRCASSDFLQRSWPWADRIGIERLCPSLWLQESRGRLIGRNRFCIDLSTGGRALGSENVIAITMPLSLLR